MKKKILIFVCLLFSLQYLFSAEENSNSEQLPVYSVLLSEEPVSQVLYIVEALTGKTVLRDAALPEILISLQMKKAMTQKEAVRAIESVLALNHIAIVELGDNLLKAVNVKLAPTQAPHFVSGSLLNAEPSEKIYSKLFQLKFLEVSTFSKLIAKLLNPELASAIIFEESNSVLITDSVSTLQRIELIIGKVDVPRHSVINSKIFRIKHGDAKEIAELLNHVMESQDEKGEKNDGSQSGNNLTLENVSSFLFSQNLTIEPDARSNSVVVCGTQADIERVESIIDQIDVLLDQVRIEVVIAQVQLSKGQGSGLEKFGLNYNVSSVNGDAAGGYGGHNTDMKVTGTSLEGAGEILSLAARLNHFGMSTVFNKAKTDSNVKILSAPTVVTTHNKEAVVRIVDSLPILSSKDSDISNPGASRATVTFKDIGIDLRVKPLIGTNGIIQLEIKQCVETRGTSVKIEGNETPSTIKREAESFVSVFTGDTVVLAGLQEKKTSENSGKLWLLGDVPILGKMLFSPKSKQEDTTELIIFIKPTIVSNPANEELYTKKMMAETEVGAEIEHYKTTGKFLPRPSEESEMPAIKSGRTNSKFRHNLRVR
ncbi:MAG: hypothetical protein LBI81_02285 [Puniceicoccales bacterium]|jgi:type II secretory pathway component GspD/PulD (secretin)|nr:hypothetical protein [Puniceicoccales bacterium]